jgi:hypothetical protein
MWIPLTVLTVSVLPFAEKTVETVNVFFQNLATRWKPGVNEKGFGGSES